jgi:hypothetical protein
MKMPIYIGNCTNLCGGFIRKLVDNSRQITSKTFKTYMIHDDIDEYVKQMGYRSFNNFQDDQCVNFYNSKVNDTFYLFFVHSSIEYIWRISKIEIK